MRPVRRRAGRARIVLLAGDAGIGKTRLIGEVCARAKQDGMLAAVGGCVQLGEASVAYAPLVEVLRELRRQLGAESVRRAARPGRSPGRRAARRREGGAPRRRCGGRCSSTCSASSAGWARVSRRCSSSRTCTGPTRQPATWLRSSAGTCAKRRSHSCSPTAPTSCIGGTRCARLLTDLERDPQVERIVLPGLTRPELITLLGEITAEPPTAEIVDDLIARTEGNPFYVEELVAAARVGGSLPATLADAILSRVSELPAPTPTVLHQAAVLGEAIDDQLLAEVTGQSPAQIADALREAVARQLLVLDESGCRFRHALVREALYDDLLPGERERLHVAAARALQAPGDGRPDRRRMCAGRCSPTTLMRRTTCRWRSPRRCAPASSRSGCMPCRGGRPVRARAAAVGAGARPARPRRA